MFSLATGLVLTACGGGGESSPPELFDAVHQHALAGEWSSIWDLQHPWAKQKFADEIAGTKQMLRTNPDPSNDNIPRQFNVSRAEFIEMSPRALWLKENEGRERWMEGSEYIEHEPALDVPGDWWVRWKTGLGREHQMRARELDGRFYLIKFVE